MKKAAVMRQLDYIRTTKNACTVPTQNGYAELRKIMRIYNSVPELSADAWIALAVKETGFAEKKVTELVAVGKACEYPVGIVPAEENESAADGTVSDELIEDPSVSLFEEVLRSIYRDNFRATAGKYRFQIIRLAEFDVTGAYAEQTAKIIDNMNGNFIKERFYAIPLENLLRVNSRNAKPRMPFYHSSHTGGQG